MCCENMMIPSYKIFSAINAKRLFIATTLVGIAACATYPSQEMSDARQALRAAHEAGAEQHAPSLLRKATTHLFDAEKGLGSQAPAYGTARQNALAAKEEAVKARKVAVAIHEAKIALAHLPQHNRFTQQAQQALEKALQAEARGETQTAIDFAIQAKALAQTQ